MSDPFTFRQVAFFQFPIGVIPNGLDTFFHSQTAHVQFVASRVAGFHDIFQTHFHRVDSQFFGDDVHLLLKPSPGGHAAVSPLGPASRTVGVNPETVVFHVGKLIRASQRDPA